MSIYLFILPFIILLFIHLFTYLIIQVTSCEKSVVASEELVADGARALWVSHRNPPAWAISSDEVHQADCHNYM